MTAQEALARPQAAKLTVEDFLLLDRSGAFAAYAKTELIDGTVIVVNAQFRPHMAAKSELAYRLRRALEASGSSLFVGIEGSVALSDLDLPQPDIVLTDDPRGPGPIPAPSLRLVVEIADHSLEFDLSRKVELYARHSIPEYWVVDVNAHRIHQMWAPGATSYGEHHEVRLGSRIEARTIPGLALETEGVS